jgi:succinate-semialdehyde dehydrogenase/glutarate-semialdehyde dehydrogenase
MSIQSINPATGEVLENFPETTSAEIERIFQSADATFEQWRRRPFPERAKRMQQAAQVLRNGKEKYARTMALEMGKPIVQGEAEVEKCAWCCDYYAENAATFLAEQARETDASRSYIRFDPIGPVLAIMPWNFPFWQVFRFPRRR